jgi:hypothetical protein
MPGTEDRFADHEAYGGEIRNAQDFLSKTRTYTKIKQVKLS